MQRLGQAMGARLETLMGLSGFGDLALTCTSERSRNYRYGHALGRGEPFDPAVTVEGATTAQAITDLSAALGLEMPISTEVARLVSGKADIGQTIESLLSRPLKAE